MVRTDHSFTVAAWVRLDNTAGWQSFVSQDSVGGGSGFYLFYREYNGGQWAFGVNDAAQSTLGVYAAVPAVDPHAWHHLVGVLDVPRREVRLYLDGDPVKTLRLNAAWQPWQADGPFVLGRAQSPTARTQWLSGGVDDVRVYAGAMNDATVTATFFPYD